MICKELDAQNVEQKERNLDDVFFVHETNAKTQKKTHGNFIQKWSATKSPMLEYIDLGVK